MSTIHSEVESVTQRLDSLTGLRWWAAFGVFAYHMANLAPLPHQNFLNVGYTGVSFFFVLSGFVLTWSARPSTGICQFWWRRFARIWPSHFLALVPCLFVFYSFSTPPEGHWWVKEFSLPIIALSIILVQGFSTNPVVLFSGNPAAWTLSCEFFFYFLHPIVNPKRVMERRYSISLLCVAVITGICMCLLRTKDIILPPPIERIWEFLLGMALAHLIRSGIRVHLPAWLVYPMLGGVVAFYWTINCHFHDSTSIYIHLLRVYTPVILAVTYALAIAVCASADLMGYASSLRHRLVVTAGEWSYVFYLVHATVLYAVRSVTGVVQWSAWTLPVWVGVFAIAIVLSALVHGYVEKPLEQKLRRWGDHRFSSQ